MDIREKKKKKPIQLVDEEEELVDINIDRKDNIAIRYNHIHSLEDPTSDSDINVEIIWWNYKKELNFRREKREPS